MDKVYGSFAVLLSAVLYGSYGIWAVLIGSELDLFFQTWLRALIVLILTSMLIYYFGWKKIERKDYRILLFLGSLGFATQMVYYSFQEIGIGLTSVFNFTAILISQYLVGKIIFDEKIGVVKIISLVMSVVGIYLIFSSELDLGKIFPVAVAILAGCAVGMQSSLTKLVSNKYSSFQISMFTWSGVMISCLPLSIIFHEKIYLPQSPTIWFYLLVFSIVGMLTFPLIVYGYRRIDVSIAGLIGLLEIPSAITFGWMFFGEVVTYSMIFGSVLILFSAALPDIYVLFKKKFNYKL